MGLPKDDCSADSIKESCCRDADLKPFGGIFLEAIYTVFLSELSWPASLAHMYLIATEELATKKYPSISAISSSTSSRAALQDAGGSGKS